jgi:hypothetical protein
MFGFALIRRKELAAVRAEVEQVSVQLAAMNQRRLQSEALARVRASEARSFRMRLRKLERMVVA